MRIVSTIGLSVVVLTAAACAGTGHIDVGVAASSLSGSATTDPAGSGEAPRLLVTVERVDVHVAGSGQADESEDAGAEDVDKTADDGAGGWITVFTGPTEVDLRSAASTSVLLGGADVPPGKVTQIRLVLGGEAALVTGQGEAEFRQTVACPSCTQTGLKIVTRGQLEVAEGETLRVDVVFDAVASVTSALEGLRLNPVVKLEAR